MTGATTGAGSAYPSRVSKMTPGLMFLVGFVLPDLWFSV